MSEQEAYSNYSKDWLIAHIIELKSLMDEDNKHMTELNFDLREDLKWALKLARSRKFTRDYSEDDRKINEMILKYKLDSR